MKGIIISFLLVAILLSPPVQRVFADQPRKLYVESRSYSTGDTGTDNAGYFYFLQDLETGTRCYGFRSPSQPGVAISCVPQQK